MSKKKRLGSRSYVAGSGTPLSRVLVRRCTATSVDYLTTTVKRVVLQWPNVNLNLHGLTGATERNALDGSDVAIVPSPGKRDMAVRNQQVIRGIETHPAKTRN